MQINSISCYRQQGNKNRAKQSNITFQKAFVATTRKNSSKEIGQVVQEFNEKWLPEILPIAKKKVNELLAKLNKGNPNPKIKNANYFSEECNGIVLAGGEGKRFRGLSNVIAKLRGKDGGYNKVCAPFGTKEGHPDFVMLQPCLVMNALFAAGKKNASGNVEDFGYHMYEKVEERGTFWHTMDHYMKHPEDIKDTLITSGDNVFAVPLEEKLVGFVHMKERGHHLLMFGVKKTPEETALKLGVAGAQKTEGKQIENFMALNSFVEKPELELAKKIAETSGGKIIANTGVLVISKEAIQKMVEVAKKEELPLQEGKIKMGSFSRLNKDGSVDPYDFSTVQQWLLKNMYTEEQVKKGQGPLVHIIESEKWCDVGEPTAKYKMLEELGRTGKFLENFPPEKKEVLRVAFQNKLKMNTPDEEGVFVVTNKYNSVKEVPPEEIAKAPLVDGLRIVG